MKWFVSVNITIISLLLEHLEQYHKSLFKKQEFEQNH